MSIFTSKQYIPVNPIANNMVGVPYASGPLRLVDFNTITIMKRQHRRVGRVPRTNSVVYGAGRRHRRHRGAGVQSFANPPNLYPW